nr:hypothetical protein GCM10025699_20390 [Microbacterium flavescens]
MAALLPGKAHPVARRERPALTPSRLTEADLAALARIVGDAHATQDDAVRALHLGGKSTPDLLRRRLDEPQAAPDAVVSPGDHAEVAALLAECARLGLAVVPFGGGTSVVGGVDPVAGSHRGVVSLDLARTAALLDLDETSLLAAFGAGTTGPQAEDLLHERGFTLGHFPQSFAYASLGGTPRHAPAVRLRAATAGSTIWSTDCASPPPSATSASAAHRPARPVPTCGSSSSARRAPSACSPR